MVGTCVQMRWALVAAAAAATVVAFVMISEQSTTPDVLLFKTNHKLNEQEKKFVSRVRAYNSSCPVIQLSEAYATSSVLC
jgi:hypothetical protein